MVDGRDASSHPRGEFRSGANRKQVRNKTATLVDGYRAPLVRPKYPVLEKLPHIIRIRCSPYARHKTRPRSFVQSGPRDLSSPKGARLLILPETLGRLPNRGHFRSGSRAEDKSNKKKRKEETEREILQRETDR